MLYLLAVLATAVGWGSGPAAVASVGAFLAFNFFFVEPIHTLSVADLGEWVALLVFLATSVVAGQLAATQRRRAAAAVRREREAVLLYDVSRLLGREDVAVALPVLAERVRDSLQADGVAIELTVRDQPQIVVAGDVGSGPARLLREGSAPTADHSAGAGTWITIVPPTTRVGAEGGQRHFVVPVALGEERIGSIKIAFAGDPPVPERDRRVLAAVGAQIAQAVERDRLRSDALDAEVVRRSDELKTALLNAVSHDLRTPIASIIASAGSLKQEDVAWTTTDLRQFVDTITSEADRLNALIENLLDLSRMEAGILKPKKGWYDIGALVDDVVGRLRRMTEHHRVVVDIPPDLPPIELDYVEIDQVLSNLVENAVRYAPPGTEIRIAARSAANEVWIDVSDRGPGIRAEAISRVFDAFYRHVDGGASAKGAGLGLAVAKGLVEAHGGRIWVENRPAGGARFAFTLPARLDQKVASV